MFNLVFSIIIYILFFLIVFVGIKKQPLVDQEEFGILINSFRGVIALAIVTGHCVRYDNCYLTPFGNMMLIGVGYFFFVSGYGLARSYITKSNYLAGFFRKRILRLLYVMALALVLTKLVSVISPIKTGFSTIHKTLPAIITAVFANTNWYLKELLMLYLMFYVIYRFAKKHRLVILFSATLILYVILYLLGYTRCWYASILCFPLGLLFYENYNMITDYLKSIKGVITSIVLLGIGLFQPILNKIFENMNHLSFQEKEAIISVLNNFLCIGCLCCLILVVNFFSFGNRLYPILSKLSASLYVLQFGFLLIAETIDWDYPRKILFVVIMDMILSLITLPIFNFKFDTASFSINKRSSNPNV